MHYWLNDGTNVSYVLNLLNASGQSDALLNVVIFENYETDQLWSPGWEVKLQT